MGIDLNLRNLLRVGVGVVRGRLHERQNDVVDVEEVNDSFGGFRLEKKGGKDLGAIEFMTHEHLFFFFLQL